LARDLAAPLDSPKKVAMPGDAAPCQREFEANIQSERMDIEHGVKSLGWLVERAVGREEFEENRKKL
jgi:hypothetical protein